MRHRFVDDLPCRNTFLALALKKYPKIDFKIFRFYLNMLYFLIFLKIFVTDFVFIKDNIYFGVPNNRPPLDY